MNQMRHQFLFGGKPTPLLRVAFGIVAGAGLGYLIASFTSEYFTFNQNDWMTWVSIIVEIGVVLGAAAQAAAPVRFFWPGWIYAITLIVPLPSGSVLTLVYWITPDLGILDSYMWTYAFGIVASFGTLLALYAWHRPQTIDEAFKPSTASAIA